MNRITFCRATIKRFEEELQKAYQRGDKRLVRRISVLMAMNRQTLSRLVPGQLIRDKQKQVYCGRFRLKSRMAAHCTKGFIVLDLEDAASHSRR